MGWSKLSSRSPLFPRPLSLGKIVSTCQIHALQMYEPPRLKRLLFAATPWRRANAPTRVVRRYITNAYPGRIDNSQPPIERNITCMRYTDTTNGRNNSGTTDSMVLYSLEGCSPIGAGAEPYCASHEIIGIRGKVHCHFLPCRRSVTSSDHCTDCTAPQPSWKLGRAGPSKIRLEAYPSRGGPSLLLAMIKSGRLVLYFL